MLWRVAMGTAPAKAAAALVWTAQGGYRKHIRRAVPRRTIFLCISRIANDSFVCFFLFVLFWSLLVFVGFLFFGWRSLLDDIERHVFIPENNRHSPLTLFWIIVLGDGDTYRPSHFIIVFFLGGGKGV